MSSTPRVFVSPAAIVDGLVTLPSEAAHHVRNVLRVRSGEALTVHDGLGTAYQCVLQDGGSSQETVARIESAALAATEPRVRITVAQALPKTPDKMEQVLQHGTEIGAAGFAFWPAQRSVARLTDGEKVDKRLARWRGIAQSAAEQSGRGLLPTVSWLGDAAELVRAFSAFEAVFTLHEAASQPLRAALEHLGEESTRLLFIVGPEGGLTEQEVALFAWNGSKSISLGARILRTETAALVALAQTIFQRDD